ncbi:nitric oxide synthase-interacting protein [Rana temporaria]|uniref:nitric oxide synthase-interacting protein n=1 Tax=Rana temporaria TaxID=8407 RepID=UPI001AAD909F|nr:nitric oxide synthase-interacting protein [Rana temporaria]
MTRHGKNCTAGAVYTYYEKRKDTAASGYGTQTVRLSRDAVKDFDCCCLSLQPCKDPVVTPDGYIFEKEAILEYILHQKKETARQMKLYEKQKNEKKAEMEELNKAAKDSKMKVFLDKEMSIISKPLNPFSKKMEGNGSVEEASSSRQSGEDKNKQLPSFWIPSLTPEAKSTLVKKPDKNVYCPMSGKPLKMKDLIDVKFTKVDEKVDRVGLINRQDRYVCAVTRDMLGNSVPCAVLRPSGAVVTLECVEKLIKKDMTDPVSGEKLTEKDILVLQRGGTGFSGSGVQLEAKEARPVMQA